MTKYWIQPLLWSVCALSLSASAQATDGLSLGVGIDNSVGRYGETTQTRVTATVLQARYNTASSSFGLSIPYLNISGPTSLLGSENEVQSLPEDGVQQRRIEGLGDVVLSESYKAFYDAETGIALDLGGKIKLPSANSAIGLGTGKGDIALQLSLYKHWDETTLIFDLGYKWIGKPSGSSYRNILNASTGLDYHYSDLFSLGGIVDFRQSVLLDQVNQLELTLYCTYKFDAQWRGQVYIYKGTSDSSPDGGGGLFMNHAF